MIVISGLTLVLTIHFQLDTAYGYFKYSLENTERNIWIFSNKITELID